MATQRRIGRNDGWCKGWTGKILWEMGSPKTDAITMTGPVAKICNGVMAEEMFED